MLFSSITFLMYFLPAVLLLNYYCPTIRGKNIILLVASLVFYAWGEPLFVLIMIFSILINYRVGYFLGETTHSINSRKCALAIGVSVNVLVLFYFKYSGFALRIVNGMLNVINFSPLDLPLADIVLPIGISFYTFQSISYLIDVYKSPQMVQRNIFDLGLFISLFPQLIAGPIVRYHDIHEQIKERKCNAELFKTGIERFIIGLSKKMLIANTMALTADTIFNFKEFSAIPYPYLILTVLCYTLQIYYDFSGYSDMAIGLGKMLGFNFLENFNYPYISKSITEFWRRWHISLSSWFKDYVYIPLGGNRKGKTRTTINLFIVFFITGLWHGAAINFLLWGLSHGILLFIEKIFGQRISSLFKNQTIKNILGHLYTMISVCILWIFFRAGTKQGFYFLFNMIKLNKGNSNIYSYLSSLIDFQVIICLLAGILFAVPWWKKLPSAPPLLKNILLIILLLICFASLAQGAYNPFIYFRF